MATMADNAAVYMSQALQLARKGWYHTSPNPRVGCVIVSDEKIIGQGYHQQAGLAHAEVNAINNAKTNGFSTQGATAYVTLEPCSHQGKTPPCAKALIEAGIATVVIGCGDPNPEVSGRGIAMLTAAGIEVTSFVLEAEAKALNAGFMQRMQTGRPRVTSKIAASVDGRTAMASGESQWITGSAARADVQRLRAQSCAIISGINTVQLDNAKLNVRDTAYALDGTIRQPLRVVLDSQLTLAADAPIFGVDGELLIVHGEAVDSHKKQALSDAGAKLLLLPAAHGRIDIAALLQHLAQLGCNEVLLEAGNTLNGAFLQAQLIDELVLYMAPTLMGSKAKPLFDLGFDDMAEQQRLHLLECRAVGNDLRLSYQPDYTKDDSDDINESGKG